MVVATVPPPHVLNLAKKMIVPIVNQPALLLNLAKKLIVPIVSQPALLLKLAKKPIVSLILALPFARSQHALDKLARLKPANPFVKPVTIAVLIAPLIAIVLPRIIVQVLLAQIDALIPARMIAQELPRDVLVIVEATAILDSLKY